MIVCRVVIWNPGFAGLVQRKPDPEQVQTGSGQTSSAKVFKWILIKKIIQYTESKKMYCNQISIIRPKPDKTCHARPDPQNSDFYEPCCDLMSGIHSYFWRQLYILEAFELCCDKPTFIILSLQLDITHFMF